LKIKMVKNKERKPSRKLAKYTWLLRCFIREKQISKILLQLKA
jgi:hypothetical protein